MTIRKPVPWIAAMLLLAFAYARPVLAQRPEKDYLSGVEADKIRDAETPNERIKLFLRVRGRPVEEISVRTGTPFTQ